MNRLGIIGFGQMGSALGRGVHAQHPERPWGAFDKLQDNVSAVESLNGQRFSRLEELCEWAQILVLAVKPQDMAEVVQYLKPFAQNRLVISVAAGISLNRLKSWLGSNRVARWMPNLAASIGECLVGVAHPPELNAHDSEESLNLARTLGGALLVPEKLMSAVTGVSGSGLAFVLSFLNGMALGGVQQGMPYQQALALAMQTCIGAAKLIQTNKKHPEEMIAQVCSPAGTTIEGIRYLKNAGFEGTVMEAVIQASERASEFES
jgi:pyrroline-5-carboxylate reductase